MAMQHKVELPHYFCRIISASHGLFAKRFPSASHGLFAMVNSMLGVLEN